MHGAGCTRTGIQIAAIYVMIYKRSGFTDTMQQNIDIEATVRLSAITPLVPTAELAINRLMDQLDELFEEMESLGCYYKDWNFEVGLVDFPAKLHGHEVMLCWKSDEESILYYHAAEAGFDGRRPIPKEMKEEAR